MALFSFIRWILGFSIAVLLAGFSVLNRDIVTINWGPVESDIDLPIYAIALSFMFIGFLLGGLIVWFNHAPLRKTRRLQKKQIKALEKELSAVNENLPQMTTAEKIQATLLPKQ